MSSSPTPPARKRLFHTPPRWVEPASVFFITICCARRGENALANDKVFAAISSGWQHYAVAGRAWTHLLLAMPDHLHALVSFSTEEQMAEVIRDWKRFITRKTSVEWQPGFSTTACATRQPLMRKPRISV